MPKHSPEVYSSLKMYQVWQRDGGSWYYTDYETIDEAVNSVKYGEYFITKKVAYEIKEN